MRYMVGMRHGNANAARCYVDSDRILSALRGNEAKTYSDERRVDGRRREGNFTGRRDRTAEGDEMTNEKRKLPIPEALYSCGTRFGAQYYSYPADKLFWLDKKQGWYCEKCFAAIGAEKGISLAEEVERQKVTK